MKTVSLFAVLVVAVCLVGCDNSELVNCQQDKDLLQGELDQANTKIVALEEKNANDQNLAMESITTMMNKQAEKDKELKQKLAEREDQIQDLEIENAELQVKLKSEIAVREDMEESLHTAMREKQALIKKIGEVQKTISTA